MLIAIAVGGVVGLLHGILITYFNVQPFIATLAGMFLTRGLSYVISTDTISISNPLFVAISEYRMPFLFDSFLSVGVIVTLFMLLVFIYIAIIRDLGELFMQLEAMSNPRGLWDCRLIGPRCLYMF